MPIGPNFGGKTRRDCGQAARDLNTAAPCAWLCQPVSKGRAKSASVGGCGRPLLQVGTARPEALARAAILLARLNLPERLWSLSPTTFSGGEQQRVNIARGFAYEYPALLLDEPTASLDETNRNVVLGLILDAKARGVAIIGIFHDEAVRQTVCDRCVDVTNFSAVAA